MTKSKDPTPIEFVAAQMSNLLYAMEYDANVPQAYRDKAHDLREKLDSIAEYRLNNPITMAVLDAEFFPKAGA
jgi:hypothetical protein